MSAASTRQEEYLKRIVKLMRVAVKRFHMDWNDYEDCLGEYEKKRAKVIGSPPEGWDSPEGLAKLSKEVMWHVKAWVRDQTRTHERPESLEQLAEDVGKGAAKEPVSSEPGPEESLLQSEMHNSLVAAERCLNEEQRRLWERHVVDGERIVDLQREFGKSANALRQIMHTIRRKVKQNLENNGMC